MLLALLLSPLFFAFFPILKHLFWVPECQDYNVVQLFMIILDFLHNVSSANIYINAVNSDSYGFDFFLICNVLVHENAGDRGFHVYISGIQPFAF